MLNKSTRKNINVDGSNLIPIYTFKQEDDGVILLSLFRNSVPLDITGQTVKLGIKRPNGTLVSIEVLEGDNPFTIDKNNIDIKLKNSVLAVPGICECDLELKDVSGKMTTASFFITVKSKVLNKDAVTAKNEFDIFEKTAKTIKEDYDQLKKIIIDENQAANLQNQINKSNEQLDTKANLNSVFTMANMGQDIKEAMTGGSVAVVGKDTVLEENIVDRQVSPIKLSERVYDGWQWDVTCRTVNVNQTSYLSILIPKNIVIVDGKIKMYADVEIDNFELYSMSVAFFNATSPTSISASVLSLKNSEYPQYFNKTEKGFNISFEFTDITSTSENITCMIAIYRKDSVDSIINFKVENLKINDVYISKYYDYGIFSSAISNSNSVNIVTDNMCLARKKDFEVLKNSFNVLSNTFKNRWYGKIINILGDSITFGVGASTTSKRYADLLANKLGCTINNYGISGTYLSHMENNNGFVDRYNAMTDVCDGVIVFGTTNDYWVGEVDLTTFRSDLIKLINGLNTKYVGKEIYFVTPYNQYWQDKNSDSLNTANAKLEDYVNIIKEECKNHGVKVIDLFAESGMDIAHNSAHKTHFANSELDGVHLNDNGHEKISDIIYNDIV